MNFNDLDGFTQGYINAALILSSDADEENQEYYTLSNMSNDAINEVIKDCKKFQEENKDLLEIAANEFNFYENSAGNDYFLTRNGHGAGFWDRKLGKVGDELTEKAKKQGETYFFITDDNKCEVETFGIKKLKIK